MIVVQGCLHDEYNMYTLLAYTSSYMYHIDGVSPSRDWNFYMHKALKLPALCREWSTSNRQNDLEYLFTCLRGRVSL